VARGRGAQLLCDAAAVARLRAVQDEQAPLGRRGRGYVRRRRGSASCGQRSVSFGQQCLSEAQISRGESTMGAVWRGQREGVRRMERCRLYARRCRRSSFSGELFYNRNVDVKTECGSNLRK